MVTEDICGPIDGCDAISVFRSDEEEPVYRGKNYCSPGRLAATSDLSVVLASPSNGAVSYPGDTRAYEFLYIAVSRDSSLTRWSSGLVLGTEVATFGGIAVLPSDDEILVATSGKELFGGAYMLKNRTPFHIKKYLVPRLPAWEQRIGPLKGSLKTDSLIVEILVSSDGSRAHLLGDDGRVYTIDPGAMEFTDAPVQVAPFLMPSRNVYHGTWINLMHAALSPDGRYLVTNRGDSNEVRVADLVDRSAWTLTTSVDVALIGGVAFNSAAENGGLLAIHADDKVIVYRWRPQGPLDELGRVTIARPYDSNDAPRYDAIGPRRALAWSGDGTRIIAASDVNRADFVAIDIGDGGQELAISHALEACPYGKNAPNDVLTANGLWPPATPTPTALPTASSTASATTTPTAPSTATGVPPSPTPTVEPTSTRAPAPLYLPLALKEDCDPTQLHADVALVIDASTSMLEETREKRTKLAAAVEAVELFLGELNLPLDQAAIVQFNGGVELLQELTGDRRALVDSLGRIQVKRQTRIDLGIQVAREEMAGSRRRPGNQAVMIVLTDGRANPVGPDAAVREAAAAKADKITVLTIGLGEDLNLAALEAMASKPGYFYRAPDGEDLREIYASIAVEIPCPAEWFWGRR